MEYSVLMTVYKNDNPSFFKLALESMINQTKKADEIVIVKDGPIGENLQNVINDIKAFNDNIVEIQLETNIGLGLALNEGLKICRNELIARMDSDDYSMPERCEKQIKEFEMNNNLDIVGLHAFEFVNDIDEISGVRRVPLTNGEIYKYARRRDPFNHPTVMYKKSKVLAVGGYGNYRKNQDTDLWIKMLQTKAVCLNLDDNLFRFRFDSNTYKKRKNWLNTKLLIEIRYKAYKNKFCSLFDFLIVFLLQLAIYILPIKIQEIIYRKMLRQNEYRK